MKNAYTLLLLIFISSLLYGQQIPNNSFENWITTGGVEEPDNWDTPNPELSIFSEFTVSKSTDAYSGDYSAKLETKNVFFYNAPGLITLADFSVDITSLDSITFSIKGGMLLQEKVTRLTGMYKYSGVSDDSASVLIYSFSRVDGVFDTIGVGLKSMGDADEWTEFIVDMEELSTNVPDTFNVVILSSGLNFREGSVLYVDSLVVETSTGIISLDRKKENISIFPNPATDLVNLEMDSPSLTRKALIFNSNGLLIKEVPFQNKKISIDVGGITSGLYTFRVLEKNTTITYGSFIVN
jgi:hypothetical protein